MMAFFARGCHLASTFVDWSEYLWGDAVLNKNPGMVVYFTSKMDIPHNQGKMKIKKWTFFITYQVVLDLGPCIYYPGIAIAHAMISRK